MPGRKQTEFVPKHCAHCGAQLVRRRYESGLLEDADRFDARQFCDQKCRFEFGFRSAVEVQRLAVSGRET